MPCCQQNQKIHFRDSFLSDAVNFNLLSNHLVFVSKPSWSNVRDNSPVNTVRYFITTSAFNQPAQIQFKNHWQWLPNASVQVKRCPPLSTTADIWSCQLFTWRLVCNMTSKRDHVFAEITRWGDLKKKKKNIKTCYCATTVSCQQEMYSYGRSNGCQHVSMYIISI